MIISVGAHALMFVVSVLFSVMLSGDTDTTFVIGLLFCVILCSLSRLAPLRCWIALAMMFCMVCLFVPQWIALMPIVGFDLGLRVQPLGRSFQMLVCVPPTGLRNRGRSAQSGIARSVSRSHLAARDGPLDSMCAHLPRSSRRLGIRTRATKTTVLPIVGRRPTGTYPPFARSSRRCRIRQVGGPAACAAHRTHTHRTRDPRQCGTSAHSCDHADECGPSDCHQHR